MANSRITLHTAKRPVTATTYKARSYRQIVGVEHDRRSLWLPGVSTEATTESFTLTAKFAANISRFFERFYIEEPHVYRNCHIGAAAMLGASTRKIYETLGAAIDIMQEGRAGHMPGVGGHGVIGYFIEGEAQALHSVVGIAKNLSIQTDCERGAFSLIADTDNLRHYQTVERSPASQFYAR
jgi:hypothetical protein